MQHRQRTGPGPRRWYLVIPIWLVLGWVVPAYGGELSLLINGKSTHFDRPPEMPLNERNWGFGLQYDFRTVHSHWIPYLTASGFIDSNTAFSNYAGGGYLRKFRLARVFERKYVAAGFVAFVMRRQDFKAGEVFPGILPAFAFGGDQFAVNVTYVPRVIPEVVPALFFQLKVRLADL